MNGATIGMEVTPVVDKPILKVLTMGHIACAVAVTGLITLGPVALRPVAATTPRGVATTLACGWPFEFCFEVNKSTRQQVNEAMSFLKMFNEYKCGIII